jgi:hypothetical protein
MILISLLGIHDSSIFPILFQFKDKIQKHIIIHDDSKYEKTMIKKVLGSEEEFKIFYSLNYKTLSIQIDEDSYDSILSCYKEIEIYSNNDFKNIYLNATDGLVSSSIILSDKLLDNGASVIAYDIFDNGFNIVTKNSMEKRKITQNIDIKTHLMLKGYKIVFSGAKIEASRRKKHVLRICENIDILHDFANKIQTQNITKVYGFDELKSLLTQIDKLEDKPFIQGGIFEEYIYWLIEDNFDFDQVMFNVKVEFEDNVFNEFDVLMIKDNHLHVIECKLKKFVEGENFVYKLDSIVDYLDDDGKGMILVIGGENDKITTKGNLKKAFSLGTKARARSADILIHHAKTFDKNDFLNNIKKHFLIN